MTSRRTVSLLLLLSAVVVVAVPFSCLAEEGSAKPRKPIRVLLTYGGHGFEEEAFFAMFDAFPNVEYTKIQLPEQADALNPDVADKYVVLVMYDMVPGISPQQQEAFIALLNKGIGVVAMHHNLGAHRDWAEYRNIIGGMYLHEACEIDGKSYPASTWDHDQTLNIHVADAEHPITKGLKDFTIHDETYHGFYVSPKVHVLLTTDNPKNNAEIAWTTQYGRSRVLYLQLGHDSQAWKNPAYPKLLLRGIRWAAGRLK
ncbi:ThuA domain-containing protein [Thermopirellula anaerolimosa]